jgi:tight adherence protein B
MARTRRNLRRHLESSSGSSAAAPRGGVLSDRLTAFIDRATYGSRLRAECETSNLNWPMLARCWTAALLIVPGACFMLTGNLWVVPGSFAAVFCAPRVAGRFAEVRRGRQDSTQIETLASDLALFLRSGTPVDEALALCSRDSGPRISSAVSRFQSDLSVGMNGDAALASLVADLDNSDLRLIAQAMLTSNETGSDVTSLMDTIGEAVRERSAIARELNNQTVQARLSGRVVTALPLVFLALSAFASRSTINILFGTVPGLVMLGIAAVMNVLGFLWIRKILNIE